VDRRIVAASIALLSACGPALSQGSGHAASASAPEPPAPSLAAALTGDPAPPPEAVEDLERTFAADGDPGVHPPVLGIAVHSEGTPLPSREPGATEHGAHEHGAHEPEPAPDDHAHQR
jgi:hypothetical protein